MGEDTKLGCKEVCAPEEEVGVGVETTSLIVSCGKLEDAEGELISESELKIIEDQLLQVFRARRAVLSS